LKGKEMPNFRLADADRVILASAGARETGLVLPLSKSLKLSSTELVPVLRRLLSKGLLLERSQTRQSGAMMRPPFGEAVTACARSRRSHRAQEHL
jgi:hypothetical protein